jgi:GNAT superfamily N-acetyltransferase
VERDRVIVAAAIQTPPWNVVLSEIDDAGALGVLVADLYVDRRSVELPGVTGPAEHAPAFSDLWSAQTGVTARIDVHERIFRLLELRPPRIAEGSARIGGPGDRPILIAWMDAFHAEAFDHPAPVDAATLVDGWLAGHGRALWLWERDGEPVSLTGIGMGTPNGFRIGPVYTPPPLRGQGFASNLVARLSADALGAGKRFGFLFTDLANPTSNRIYQALGYEPVRDVDMWRFETAP